MKSEHKGVFEEQKVSVATVQMAFVKGHIYKAVGRNLGLILTMMGNFPSKKRNDMVRFVFGISCGPTV